MPVENDESKKPEENSNEPPKVEKKPPTIEELQADVERWKTLSRQNETNYNATRTELEKLKQASMSDAEKALEQAKQDARNATLAEVSQDLIKAALEVQATKKSAKLPDLDFLNLDRFKADDGRPNTEAITSFLDSLPTEGESKQSFPPLGGAGHNKGGTADFTSMDPNDLADFITDGSFL
jgi:hypothetical protein